MRACKDHPQAKSVRKERVAPQAVNFCDAEVHSKSTQKCGALLCRVWRATDYLSPPQTTTRATCTLPSSAPKMRPKKPTRPLLFGLRRNMARALSTSIPIIGVSSPGQFDKFLKGQGIGRRITIHGLHSTIEYRDHSTAVSLSVSAPSSTTAAFPKHSGARPSTLPCGPRTGPPPESYVTLPRMNASTARSQTPQDRLSGASAWVHSSAGTKFDARGIELASKARTHMLTASTVLARTQPQSRNPRGTRQKAETSPRRMQTQACSSPILMCTSLSLLSM